MKISKDPNKNWNNNAIQFPRFIEEAQAAGAFTDKVLKEMAMEMDLTLGELHEIMDRARIEWESIKEKLNARHAHYHMDKADAE